LDINDPDLDLAIKQNIFKRERERERKRDERVILV
jgi:hypothetical protein